MGKQSVELCSRLQVAKKRGQRPLDAAAASSIDPVVVNSLPYDGFYIRDELTNRYFLVDTGAFVSVIPASDPDRATRQRDDTRLVSANGTPIVSYGTVEVSLQFARKSYTWSFTIADVAKPLLGADFLAHHSLLVDVAGRRLVDENLCPLPIGSITGEMNTCKPYRSCKYDFVFNEFSGVFKPELRQVPGRIPRHGIYHRIHTTGPPLFSRPRRLNPEKLKIVK
jgi:cleavage and polyadenylation specificity factor subunit 1